MIINDELPWWHTSKSLKCEMPKWWKWWLDVPGYKLDAEHSGTLCGEPGWKYSSNILLLITIDNSIIIITIVAIVHLITDLTWDVAALLSLNLVAHLPTHCIVIIGTTCDQNFLLFGDFFFIVIRMMEMMMIRKAMIVIIMMMMILAMVTCLGTFSQTSLGTWLHTLRGTSLQT